MKHLPLPDFVNLEAATSWNYQPIFSKLLKKAEEWRHNHDIKFANTDKKKTLLLLIDWQRDLCLPEGGLFSPGGEATQLQLLEGAIQDTQKIVTFIYKNTTVLTNIMMTFDTRMLYHISSPVFWKNAEGYHPEPYTVVNLEDIKSGKLSPNPEIANWLCSGNKAWLKKQIEFYIQELAKTNKDPLTIWPPYCLLGSEGHNLVGLVDEARIFHAIVRGSQTHMEVRTTNPLTEQYSILKPEVLRRHDGIGPLASKNTALIQRLLEADNLIVAGQTSSLSVRLTLEDLLSEIKNKDEKAVQKIFFLQDCMSPLVIRDSSEKNIIDYSNKTEEAFKNLVKAGMHPINSNDNLESHITL